MDNISLPHNAQRGAALLVAMVMIFMLSVLGVSAMRGSTIERRMATNSIQTQTNFQAAESSSEIGLNDSTNLENAYEANGTIVTVDTDLQHAMGSDSEVQLQYIGEGIAEGFSTGSGSNKFMALRFEARGLSNADTVRARSEILQGANRVVPAP
ncbi:MAG: PilX N-terminal domain-containing pilus assembly protein [Granulosicoccus sp.]